jgi:hypothetical protein
MMVMGAPEFRNGRNSGQCFIEHTRKEGENKIPHSVTYDAAMSKLLKV